MLPTKGARLSTIEFSWVDGKTDVYKLARAVARTKDGHPTLSVAFSTKDFSRAYELFKLIGSKKTTIISINGAIANKALLSRVFECFDKASRSPDPSYCFRRAPVAPPIDITIRLNTLGISASSDKFPPSRPRQIPCKLCSGVGEDLNAEAIEIHANICPKFRV